MYITKSTLVNALRSHQWKRHIHQCSFFATECGREGGVPYEARIHCCNSLHQKLMLVGHREPYGGQVCVCVGLCVGLWGLGKVGGTTHPPVLYPYPGCQQGFCHTHSAPLGNHSSHCCTSPPASYKRVWQILGESVGGDWIQLDLTEKMHLKKNP